jgi:hypothetical protein
MRTVADSPPAAARIHRAQDAAEALNSGHSGATADVRERACLCVIGPPGVTREIEDLSTVSGPCDRRISPSGLPLRDCASTIERTLVS